MTTVEFSDGYCRAALYDVKVSATFKADFDILTVKLQAVFMCHK